MLLLLQKLVRFSCMKKNKVEVVIPDDQLSLAIGRKGQNVKLASNLTSLEIDILTEDEESERRQQEFKEKVFY